MNPRDILDFDRNQMLMGLIVESWGWQLHCSHFLFTLYFFFPTLKGVFHPCPFSYFLTQAQSDGFNLASSIFSPLFPLVWTCYKTFSLVLGPLSFVYDSFPRSSLSSKGLLSTYLLSQLYFIVTHIIPNKPKSRSTLSRLICKIGALSKFWGQMI